MSHNNIGQLKIDTGKPAEALAAFERARPIRERLAREHPESPDYASDLGATLNNLARIDLGVGRFAEARDRLRDAITLQKKALASYPRHPIYRQFLGNQYGNLLRAARGLHDDALTTEAEKGLADLAASDPRIRALDARLAVVLGGSHPKDNAERLDLAQRAYVTKRYAIAARLWDEALKHDPKLTEDRRAQHRYNAACAAALAAAGTCKDDPEPDDAARAKLRGQALGWLQAELAIWSRRSTQATRRPASPSPRPSATGSKTPTWPASAMRSRSPDGQRPSGPTGVPSGTRWAACSRSAGRPLERPSPRRRIPASECR